MGDESPNVQYCKALRPGCGGTASQKNQNVRGLRDTCTGVTVNKERGWIGWDQKAFQSVIITSYKRFTALKTQTIHGLQTWKNERDLEQTITNLEEEFYKSNLIYTQLSYMYLEKELAEQKIELEKIIEFLKKTRWFNEEGSKYFLIIGKLHRQGTINQTKINDDFVTSEKKIIVECVSFYKAHYTTLWRLCYAQGTHHQGAKCFSITQS